MADDRDLFGAPVTPRPSNAPKSPTYYTVPSDAKPSECRGETCTAVVYWIRGIPAPVSCDVEGGVYPVPHEADGRGVSHFLNCPDADQFSKGARATR